MTSLERTHHTIADLTASLALLTLIAQFAMLLIMIISFRELRDDITMSRTSDQIELGGPWESEKSLEKSHESSRNALDVWEELVSE